METFDPTNVEHLTQALLNGRGMTDPAIRRNIEAHAARHAGAERAAADVPADLTSYLDKIALHAYKVTDKDIDGLRAAGYTEDQIFEITHCAALGAGAARLQRTLALLDGK